MAYDELRFFKKNIQTFEYLPVIRPRRKKPKKKPIDPNLKICPNCNKEQNKNNKKCERCGLDFNIGTKILRIINNKCSDEDKILLISSNEEKLVLLKNLFKENNFQKYLKILHDGNCEELSESDIPKELRDEISILIDINKLLNLYYDIPIYSNVYSSRYLTNLDVLKENVNYIKYTDFNTLNDYIKSFQKYVYLISSLDIKYNNISNLNKIINKLVLIKKDMCRFNENIGKLYDFYERNGINISDSPNENIELINDVKILFENPSIIENETEIHNFLNLLQDYKEINSKNKDSSYYINGFKTKNRFLKEIILKYNNYLSKYNLNLEILNAKQKFSKHGFNLHNLIEFNEFKEIMSSFHDPTLVNDDNYFLLNDKLEEYLKENNNSFSDNFNKYRKKLEKNIKKKIKERQRKIPKNSNDEIYELLYLLNKKLNDLSVNVNTFHDFKENIENINVLTEHPKLIGDYTFFKGLHTLENYSNKNTNLTFKDFFSKNYEKLYEIINIFLIKINNEYNQKNYSIIKKNTDEILTIIKELKINMSSIDNINTNLKTYENLFNHNKEKSSKIKKLRSLIQSVLDRLNIKSMQNRPLKEFLDYSNSKIDKYEKIISLKNDIIKTINNSENIDEKFNNSTFLIKKCYDLKNELDMDEYKRDIDNVSYNYRHFKEINNYIDILNMDVTIVNLYKKYEYDIKFTSSYYDNLFDENTINFIESSDIENEIAELNSISEKLDYLLNDKNQNTLKHENLNDFSSEYYNINYFYKNIIEKVKNCDINNFNEVINDLKKELLFKTNDHKLNRIIHNMTIIEEIINLSCELELENAENIFNYEYDQLILFHKQIIGYIKFTDYYNMGLFNTNIFKFYRSHTFSDDLNNLDLKLTNVQKYIENNNIDYSIFTNSELINIDELIIMKEITDETTYLFENEPNDKTQKIENIQTIIDNLFKLCEEYPIFDENNTYINELTTARNKINKYYKMSIYENKIDSHEEIITNNLNNIWRGYSTNINKIKNKFDVDLKFTKLFKNNIFTLKTIQNINNLSKSDLKKLNKLESSLISLLSIFKTNFSDENIYSNNEKLIKEINKLDKSNINSDTIKILSNINLTLKKKELENLIKILNIKINQPKIYNSILELEEKLNSYTENNYEYSEDSLNKLSNDIKYSQLKNLGIITDKNEKLIRNDFENFLNIINQFEEYRMLIIERITNTKERELTENFDIILTKKRIFLINEKTIKEKLSKQFVNQFDKFFVLHDSDKMKIHNVLTKKDRLYKIMG